MLVFQCLRVRGVQVSQKLINSNLDIIQFSSVGNIREGLVSISLSYYSISGNLEPKTLERNTRRRRRRRALSGEWKYFKLVTLNFQPLYYEISASLTGILFAGCRRLLLQEVAGVSSVTGRSSTTARTTLTTRTTLTGASKTWSVLTRPATVSPATTTPSSTARPPPPTQGRRTTRGTTTARGPVSR